MARINYQFDRRQKELAKKKKQDEKRQKKLERKQQPSDTDATLEPPEAPEAPEAVDTPTPQEPTP